MPDSVTVNGVRVAVDTLPDGTNAQVMKLADGTLDSTNLAIVDASGRQLVALDSQSGIYAEDAPHVGGDRGALVFGVRSDSQAAAFADTNGDYSPILVSPMGAVAVQAPIYNGGAGADGQTLIGLGRRDLTSTIGTPTPVAVGNAVYNGASWDRERGNVDGTALASAARTATTNSGDIVNYNGRGVVVILDVAAIAATPSVTLKIEGKDPASGKYVTLLTGAAVAAVSTNLYTLYPGVTETANVDVAMPLPRTFRITVAHADADSITYSVGYSLIL